MLLNIHNKSSWYKITLKVIEKLPYINLDKIVENEDPEWMFSDKLDYLINQIDREKFQFDLNDIETDLDKEFRFFYHKIKGYHSTNILREKSFLENGIRKLSEELLYELAIEWFSDYVKTCDIRRACSQYCIKSFDRYVFLFIDSSSPKEPSQNHYAIFGSEALQRLTHDLKLADEGVMFNKGNSCLIECNVPINTICRESKLEIWKNMITYTIKKVAGYVDGNPFENYSFKVEEDIDKEHITKFHYLNKKRMKFVGLRH